MAFPTAAVTSRGGNEHSEFSLITDGDMMKYLERIVRGNPIPPTDPVHVLKDFYQFNPKQLSEMYQMGAQDSLYFITSPFRQIIRPVTSGGYWEDTCFGAIITANWRTTKGTRKTLFYCEGEPKSGIRTEWRLRECKLVKKMDYPNPKVDELVLCKVYKVCDPSFFEDGNLEETNYDDEYYDHEFFEDDVSEDAYIDEDEFFEYNIAEETNIVEDD